MTHSSKFIWMRVTSTSAVSQLKRKCLHSTADTSLWRLRIEVFRFISPWLGPIQQHLWVELHSSLNPNIAASFSLCLCNKGISPRKIPTTESRVQGLVVNSPILLYSIVPCTFKPAPWRSTAILPVTVRAIHVSVTLFFWSGVKSGVRACLDSNTAHSTAEAAERFKDSTKPKE